MMSMFVRRIASTVGAAAVVLGAGALVAPAAQASTSAKQLIYTHYYSGSDALTQCKADGKAGVSAGYYDIFTCTALRVDYVELMAYVYV